MRPLIFIFLCSVLLAVSDAFADVEGFVVWQPEPDGIRYLIPKITGETPDVTAARWQQLMKKSKTYGTMENAQRVQLATDVSRFTELPSSSTEKPNVAVVLNRPNQMTGESPYLKTVVNSFEKHGPNLYALPIGLELALKPQERRKVRALLNSFDGQLGVGGDDAHPVTWGQKDISRTEGDINWRRDVQQSAYMKEYLKNGKGRVFYVCGSMQRAAVVSGYELYDDIGHHLSSPKQRKVNGPIMLEVVVEPGSEIAIAAGAEKFKTSNFHHAAVNADLKNENPKSAEITGYNLEPDGTRGRVVKSIEFPGNAGFATQFHPEFEGSPAERRIVEYVATGWKLRGRYAPAKIVECLEKSLLKLMPTASSREIRP